MAILEARVREIEQNGNSGIEIAWSGNQTDNFELTTKLNSDSILQFERSWSAFLNRFRNDSLGLYKRNQTEIENQLRKKSEWLSNELGWSNFTSDSKFLNKLTKIFVIAESRLIGIPFELLPFKEGFLGDQIQISRKLIIKTKPPNDKIGKSAFFIFDDVSNQIIQKSTIKENLALANSASKKTQIISVAISTLRNSRFKEEISVTQYFHYAGHLERGVFQFRTEPTIEASEISKWNLSNLEIAFLNGCNSLSSSETTDSLGIAMLHAGVKSIVGFTNTIPTNEAEEVGIIFWKEYFQSKSIERSLDSAKKFLKDLGSPFRFTLIHFGLPLDKQKKRNLIPFILIITIAIMLLIAILLYSGVNESSEKRENLNLEKNYDITSSVNPKSPLSDQKNTELKSKEYLKATKERSFEKSPLDVEIDNLDSESLKNKIRKFLSSDHPIYDIDDRLKIARTILTMNTSEANKEILIMKEMKY